MPGDRYYIDVNRKQYIVPSGFVLDVLDELLHDKLDDGQVALKWVDVMTVDDGFDFTGPEPPEH